MGELDFIFLCSVRRYISYSEMGHALRTGIQRHLLAASFNGGVDNRTSFSSRKPSKAQKEKYIRFRKRRRGEECHRHFFDNFILYFFYLNNRRLFMAGHGLLMTRSLLRGRKS